MNACLNAVILRNPLQTSSIHSPAQTTPTPPLFLNQAQKHSRQRTKKYLAVVDGISLPQDFSYTGCKRMKDILRYRSHATMSITTHPYVILLQLYLWRHLSEIKILAATVISLGRRHYFQWNQWEWVSLLTLVLPQSGLSSALEKLQAAQTKNTTQKAYT